MRVTPQQQKNIVAAALAYQRRYWPHLAMTNWLAAPGSTATNTQPRASVCSRKLSPSNVTVMEKKKPSHPINISDIISDIAENGGAICTTYKET